MSETLEKEKSSELEHVKDEPKNLKIEILDVYSGGENIPFEERAPEYKKILLTEFL